MTTGLAQDISEQVIIWGQYYASLGLYVTPLKAPYIDDDGSHKGGKEAFLPEWQIPERGCSKNPERIIQWWKGNNYNIGVVTGRMSGVLVIDVDGPGGVETMQRWEAEGIPLLTGASTVSGSGARPGGHLWFKYPAWLPATESISSRRLTGKKGGDGIDVKADGGMIVVPPSFHKNQKNYYKFHQTQEAGTPLPEVPEKLLTLLLAKKLASFDRPDMPTPTEVDGLLGDNKTRPIWFNHAKKKLKNRECFPYLFEMLPPPEKGFRWEDTRSLIGQVCSLLFRDQGIEVEHIFSLFYEYLLQLNAHPKNDQDWLSTAWDQICTFWEKETEKEVKASTQEAEKKVAEIKAEVNKKPVFERVLEGARQWGDPEALKNGSAEHWILRRLVAYDRDSYYVMTLKGMYSPYPVKEKQIISKCYETGVVPGLVTFSKPGKPGEADSLLSATEIINKHTVSIKEMVKIVGTANKTEAWFDGDRFMIPMYYRRTDLVPEFNADCDAWLRVLFGLKYEEGIRWIANALAFEDGAICALSLVGPPNAGKSLLASGLAETINTERYATGEDLVNRFNDSFGSTGWLLISEGFPPVKGPGFSSIPDAFKKFISGEALPIEAKFASKQMIKNPIRMIMVANNYRILSTLTGGKDLTTDDRDAIAQRILHIDVPAEAREWMRQRGDYALTSGWVSSAAGGKSKYTLAKHFLWLYQNRPVRNGETPPGRFLVEGNLSVDDLVSKHVILQTSNALNVMLTLVKIIEGRASGLNDGVHIDLKTKELWASCGVIADAFNNEVSRAGKASLNVRDVGAILRSLASRSVNQKFGTAVKWFKIRTELLLQEARENGWPIKKLEQLVEDVVSGPEDPKTQEVVAISEGGVH